MVVIRLSRHGSKKRVVHNIVVAHSKSRRDGKFIEKLGFYDPSDKKNVECLRININRLTYWLSVGSKPTMSVKRLIKISEKNLKGN